jgi:hypothetical protein
MYFKTSNKQYMVTAMWRIDMQFFAIICSAATASDGKINAD